MACSGREKRCLRLSGVPSRMAAAADDGCNQPHTIEAERMRKGCGAERMRKHCASRVDPFVPARRGFNHGVPGARTTACRLRL